ncbi:hypothetical protein HOY80DRAFT_550720 [Tuber brumale]|nr:hypothetical protein HOY80DRAFT_550720 [Tuber brumale]
MAWIPRKKEEMIRSPQFVYGCYHWIIICPHQIALLPVSLRHLPVSNLALRWSPISVPRTRVRDASSIRQREPPTRCYPDKPQESALAGGPCQSVVCPPEISPDHYWTSGSSEKKIKASKVGMHIGKRHTPSCLRCDRVFQPLVKLVIWVTSRTLLSLPSDDSSCTVLLPYIQHPESWDRFLGTFSSPRHGAVFVSKNRILLFLIVSLSREFQVPKCRRATYRRVSGKYRMVNCAHSLSDLV